MEVQTKSLTSESQIEWYDYEVRAHNDASTLLAETLNGRMRTSFDYILNGRELYAACGGAMGGVFEAALDQADELANINPSLNFEVRRRRQEIDEYHDMLKMAGGLLPNTMVVVSDFPPELMTASQDVGGYNVRRKQTMLRVISRLPDGRLRMQSQSLDGSNRQALEAIYAGFGLTPRSGELLGQRIYTDQNEVEQAFLIDKLTGVYDRSMELQTGVEHLAGQPVSAMNTRETYQFVQSHPDLIDYLANKMLAGECNDQFIFSVAATMTRRYESGIESVNAGRGSWLTAALLQQEMKLATSEARQQNRTFSACGSSVSADQSVSSELSTSGYGNKADEDKFGSLKFSCPHCHRTNNRPRGKLLSNCQHCHKDVRCK